VLAPFVGLDEPADDAGGFPGVVLAAENLPLDLVGLAIVLRFVQRGILRVERDEVLGGVVAHGGLLLSVIIR